ncbi:acyl-CoA Delta(11) desaturase-like [Apis dorsata]|uniref:acyl-CoA Delta(11) desaturase-like n=1 Tax=Apis dorsata TaxID=7462 RepID=UPI0003DF6638|nr:acyl-CoA Delta(11) desaturase-like [Apis dorsata]XP_006607954.1 acyl-CoA Delta(11) desaturase-like [Apis dorsata]XP_031365965.1 acyl-CoA Delta(11) desaturase-like [Apis dorsata]
MAPNLFGSSATLYLEASQQDVHQEKSTIEKENNQKLVQKSLSSKSKYKWKIVWRNVIAFIYFHLGGLYGFYLWGNGSTKAYTILWTILVTFCIAMGITAGAHRLWSHRAYKAKWPLRFVLMLLQTTAFQNHIYEWVRDHRVHHKFTDTDADPHNAQRGFFFSHMGWLLVRKHPDVFKKGATVDLSDLEKDPIVVWQRRLYIVLMPLLCFVVPVWIPYYFWNEKFINAWYSNLARYVFSLNATWLVNSAAHMWGMRPYDKNIGPTENLTVSILGCGEGWHNYHHVFPWDYKAGEFGNYNTNFSTAFIDFCARLGLAYDMKTVPVEVIKKRAARTGDGSRYDKNEAIYHHNHEDMKWGWGDIDMKPEEIQEVNIYNKGD